MAAPTEWKISSTEAAKGNGQLPSTIGKRTFAWGQHAASDQGLRTDHHQPATKYDVATANSQARKTNAVNRETLGAALSSAGRRKSTVATLRRALDKLVEGGFWAGL